MTTQDLITELETHVTEYQDRIDDWNYTISHESENYFVRAFASPSNIGLKHRPETNTWEVDILDPTVETWNEHMELVEKQGLRIMNGKKQIAKLVPVVDYYQNQIDVIQETLAMFDIKQPA